MLPDATQAADPFHAVRLANQWTLIAKRLKKPLVVASTSTAENVVRVPPDARALIRLHRSPRCPGLTDGAPAVVSDPGTSVA